MDAGRDALLAFLRHPRYEVLPLAGIADRVAADVGREVRLTVTASPARGLEATLATAEQLAGHGFRVVPHLAARQVVDEAHLREVVARLAALGVEDVFVVAGDQPEPAGRFPDALSLLEAMSAARHPFREVGIAGYPESHPFVPDDVTVQAMWDKRRYATYVVSQICFDAGRILRWAARERQRGVTLPIHAGVPGLVDWSRLLRVSRKIGRGESARFLRWHAGWLLRLALPGFYRPDRLVAPVAAGAAERGIAGLHLFTFNEVARTERWRRELLRRLEG
jgi:methylenetetrahydrofolate reductase (NADPH)